MKVGLDVDGVLANFYLHMCRKFNKPYNYIDKWDIDWISENFYEIKEDKRFWLTIPVLNPPEAITFEFDYYITSLPKELKQIRQQWLSINGFPNKPVIISYDKLKTCKAKNITILIDDKPSTLKALREDDSVFGIQYIPYYMNPEFEGSVTIRHLGEVNDILRILREKDGDQGR